MDSTLRGRQRGRQRPGSGRKRMGEAKKTVRIRISLSPTQNDRWKLLKTLRRLPGDSDVAAYLLDTAFAEAGQSG